MRLVTAHAMIAGLLLAHWCSAADPTNQADRCIDSRQYWPDIGPIEERVVVDPTSTLAGPPPGGDHPVGAEWDWWIWRLNGFPEADLKPCTIRGKGPTVYVVVENQAWADGLVTQADVDYIIDHWENTNFTTTRTGGIYDLGVESFGDPPLGLDDDPRIYLLYYDFDVSSDGFFWIFDTMDDATAPFHSNECEVLYLNCGPDAGVDHDPSSDYMIGVVAHEFAHLIHNAYDQDEAGWVSEGLGEFAMYWYGADDPSWIASFVGNPDIPLIPPSGNGPHYGAAWFWTVYLASHYGLTNMTRELVVEPADSTIGVDNALAALGYSETFEDVFRDWVVANYLDDPGFGSGRYGYPDWDYAPLQASAIHASYPVPQTNATVQLWAADYLRFDNWGTLQSSFDGSDSNRFMLRAIEIDAQGALDPLVSDVGLDALQAGSFDAPTSPGYEQLVLVPAAMAPSSRPSSYSYSADAVPPTGPITLYAVKNSSAPDADLDLHWSGGTPPFDLYRAIDKTQVGDPGSLFQQDVSSVHTLSGEFSPEVYLWVEEQ